MAHVPDAGPAVVYNSRRVQTDVDGLRVKILVTGAEGYIGSLLAPLLLERGHRVLALDTGFFRRGWLHGSAAAAAAARGSVAWPALTSKDVRQIEPPDLAGLDAVIHLAELSNDPLGDLRPQITQAINFHGSLRLARLAKRCGVARFVYSSSCSVYGAGSDAILTEESAPNPQTEYARCKVLVESALHELADDGFSPVSLRNATAYGASPRMRFDIVLNNLAGLARATRKIAMTSDGTPWRPLVHVLDICRAMICAVEAPREAVHAQTFNIGSTEQNLRVRDIAALVAEAFTDCEISFGSQGGDTRSYRVSFGKAYAQLPGFRCEWDARKGVAQLHALFERLDLRREDFEFAPFTRLEELKYLLRTRQLDDDLYWTR